MNYLNKFTNLVSKGVDSIKNKIGNDKKAPSDQVLIQNQMSLQNIQSNPASLNKGISSGPTSISSMFNMQPMKKKGDPDQNFMSSFKLIRGEGLIDWETCQINLNNTTFQCKCIVTSYRLYLSPKFTSSNMLQTLSLMEYQSYYPNGYFSLPLHLIEKVEKNEKTENKGMAKELMADLKFTLIITMRDTRKFSLVFLCNPNQEQFYYCLYNMVLGRQMPFAYQGFARKYNSNIPVGAKNQRIFNGWDVYNPEKEYSRQNVPVLATVPNSVEKFRRTTANENYGLCETYPKFLIVPAQMTDQELKEASKYRTKNRLPVLTYYNKDNDASIWRCSQPKPGIANARNSFDEKLLNFIGTFGKNNKLKIYDCRSFIAALANKAKGDGYEIAEFYNNAEMIFCDIGNIHDGRNALNKLYTLLYSKDFQTKNNLVSLVAGTGWLEFIYMIIKAGIEVAKNIQAGNSCVIHCSDGWDRCSQVSALPQIFLDPYFRTINGFMVLIEKDFLSFGHQCKYRNGYYNTKEITSNQVSPILLQFLDAVQQIWYQYPMYFEFNMTFLVFIANNVSNGKYGTFLYNHEKERESQNAKKETMSIWSEINDNLDIFKNQLFNYKTMDNKIFIPDMYSYHIRLWEEYFCQFSLISKGMNYDKLVKGYMNAKVEKNIRITCESQYKNEEMKKYKCDLNEKNNYITSMKNLILELYKKKNVDFDNLDISKEGKELLDKLIKDDNGENKVNEEKKDISNKEKIELDPEYYLLKYDPSVNIIKPSSDNKNNNIMGNQSGSKTSSKLSDFMKSAAKKQEPVNNNPKSMMNIMNNMANMSKNTNQNISKPNIDINNAQNNNNNNIASTNINSVENDNVNNKKENIVDINNSDNNNSVPLQVIKNDNSDSIKQEIDDIINSGCGDEEKLD